MLVDTDILIDYLRGHPQAVAFLETHAYEIRISAVSVAELFQGVREGSERQALSKFASSLTVLPLTAEIAEQAGILHRDYKAKTGCGLADCMIAATAVNYTLELATLNAKHFTMLKGVQVPYQKP